jgi:hypothetical protein
MIWLILANGLLVGSWITEMGQEGSCKVCNARALERTEHTFSHVKHWKGCGKRLSFVEGKQVAPQDWNIGSHFLLGNGNHQ